MLQHGIYHPAIYSYAEGSLQAHTASTLFACLGGTVIKSQPTTAVHPQCWVPPWRIIVRHWRVRIRDALQVFNGRRKGLLFEFGKNASTHWGTITHSWNNEYRRETHKPPASWTQQMHFLPIPHNQHARSSQKANKSLLLCLSRPILIPDSASREIQRVLYRTAGSNEYTDTEWYQKMLSQKYKHKLGPQRHPKLQESIQLASLINYTLLNNHSSGYCTRHFNINEQPQWGLGSSGRVVVLHPEGWQIYPHVREDVAE